MLKLRQLEVQTAQGKNVVIACKEADMFEQSVDNCEGGQGEDRK